MGDLGLILGLGRSPGGGHGNSRQYSCLENRHGQRSLVGFPYKQAKSMIEDTKGARLSINSEIFVEEETKPEDIPYTLPWLCKRTGVNGLLNQYRSAVSKKDLRKAGQIEAKIYQIEKDVKKNDNYPENLRKRFLSYVENKIEDIDDKY